MNKEQMKTFYEANCEGKALPKKEQSNNFNDNWKFPNILREQYGKYTKYEISPMNQKYRSGRPKFICAFKKDDDVVGLHLAMQLTSKKGEPYFVAQTKPMNIDDGEDDETDESDDDEN